MSKNINHKQKKRALPLDPGNTIFTSKRTCTTVISEKTQKIGISI